MTSTSSAERTSGRNTPTRRPRRVSAWTMPTAIVDLPVDGSLDVT